MAESECNHYVPQFLLRQFKINNQRLYELDKTQMTCTTRSVRKMGQIRGLVPEHIERGVLGTIDSTAGTLLHDRLYTLPPTATKILLTSQERSRLAEFFAYFTVRTPFHRVMCEWVGQQQLLNHEKAIVDFKASVGPFLQKIRENDPDLYARDAKLAGGSENLIAETTRLVGEKVSDPNFFKDNADLVFQRMHVSGRHHDIAEALYNRRWTLLRTKKTFVIGDNPLCRWSTKRQAPHNGITLPDTKITLPLSRSISIKMVEGLSDFGVIPILAADKRTTRELNWRQEMSALTYVYGPWKELLLDGRKEQFNRTKRSR